MKVKAPGIALSYLNEAANMPVPAFNDDPVTSHIDIMELFDAAIRLADLDDLDALGGASNDASNDDADRL
jgi:hypothetical protein